MKPSALNRARVLHREGELPVSRCSAKADDGVTPPPERLATRVQLRTAFSTDEGEVARLIIRLEYWLDGDWREVVRDDHDRDAAGGHDDAEEGLHCDVYRDGGKYRTALA